MSVLTKSERLELILTYYILWKIKKEPRVIRKIIKHLHAPAQSWNKGDLNVASIADLGTKDHDLLDGLADDDHTQYVLDAGDTMTGDLDMKGGGSEINIYRNDDITLWLKSDGNLGEWQGAQFVPVIHGTGSLGTAAKWWGTIRGVSYYVAGAVVCSNNVGFQTAPTGASVYNLQSHTGVGYQTAVQLVGGYADVPRAGDITGLAGKTLTFPTIGATVVIASPRVNVTQEIDFVALAAAPGAPVNQAIYCADSVFWDPLGRGVGQPYLVFYDGAVYKAVSAP